MPENDYARLKDNSKEQLLALEEQMARNAQRELERKRQDEEEADRKRRKKRKKKQRRSR